MLKAVTNGDVDQVEKILRNGWPVNEIIDKRGRYSAATLACYLDNLEMLHLLDMYGADLS